MSMIGTLLAFVVIPLRAKLPAPKPDEKVVPFALDFWRKAGQALMKENERLRKERDDARAASLQLMDERDALRAQLRSLANQQARQLASRQQAAQAQQIAQYHQQAQALLGQQQQNLQGFGQLGRGQNHLYNLQDFCNCVPSREQMLTRDFNNGGL